MYKSVLIVCAQALLIQSAFSACAGIAPGCGCNAGFNNAGLGYNGLAGYGLGAGCGCGVASTGGGLPVSSGSLIAPIGVSVLSENSYEGTLTVGGNLPFLGTVGLEGILPTAGTGAVSYGCGNGAVGIAEEGPIVTGITAPGGYGPGVGAIAGPAGLGYGVGPAGYGLGGIGYGAGLGNGCGCGGFY